MLLLITDQKELGNALVDLLFQKGIYCLLSPLETGEFFCREMDTGGVILDCQPQPKQAEGVALANTLKSLYPEMPLAVLWKQRRTPPPSASLLLDPSGEKNDLYETLLHFCREDCGWIDEPISSVFLQVGKDPKDTMYLGQPFHLSPIENEVLRFLFYRSPSPTSTRALCYLCSPLRPFSKNTMYVLIRRINRRAKKFFPYPLIVNEYGKGYRLRHALLRTE
jgi:DNA-binding response OmpR family regulator